MSTKKPKRNDYTIIVDLRKGRERKTSFPELSKVDGDETIYTSRGRSIFVVAIGDEAIVQTQNLGTGNKTTGDFLKEGKPAEITISASVSTGRDHSIKIIRSDDDDSDESPMTPYPIIVDVE